MTGKGRCLCQKYASGIFGFSLLPQEPVRAETNNLLDALG
jgi:hypothetical protein